MSESDVAQRIAQSVDVRVGIQYRTDALTGGASRINPARSIRPKAAVVSEPAGDQFPGEVLPGVRPPSSTAHLPVDLARMIHAFKDRDPFYPPEKLYKMIEPLSEAFLARVRPELGAATTRSVIQRGEAVLFLNKFPFTENHAVITSSESYYVSMPDLTVTQLNDTLAVCCEFIRVCALPDAPPSSTEPDRVPACGAASPCPYMWPSIVWNYMPPSAGSIIHPHLQCFVETVAPPLARDIALASGHWAAAAAAVAAATGADASAAPANFFTALVAQERALADAAAASAAEAAAAATAAGDSDCAGAASPTTAATEAAVLGSVELTLAASRFIAQVGAAAVLAPFAPRTANEVHIVVPGFSTLSTLGESPAVLRDVARALVGVIRQYHRLGFGAFNMASFSAPESASEPGSAAACQPDPATGFSEDMRAGNTVVFKMWSRPYPSGIYVNDAGPTERHYDLNVVESLPEVLAADMRKHWNALVPAENAV